MMNSYFFLVTAFFATVEGGVFKATEARGYARATEIMNSKSTHDYRWSIRIIGQESIYIGIASKLKRTQDWILYYDENSLTYAPLGGYVWKANTVIEHKFIKADSGDEVHFRFQPKLKKFSISFVSSILHDCF